MINNSTLTGIERMIYWKPAVEGKAAYFISNPGGSSGNFAKTW